MRIDPQTGTFTLDDGTELSPALTRAAFILTPVGMGAEVAVRNEPWLSLSFELREERMTVVVQFEGEPLRSITFASVDPRFGDSWSDWSEATERDRASETARWLAARGLEIGPHPWGAVWAGFEPRSGDGSAIVTYERWH